MSSRSTMFSESFTHHVRGSQSAFPEEQTFFVICPRILPTFLELLGGYGLLSSCELNLS
jgi:hypothetical protein